MKEPQPIKKSKQGEEDFSAHRIARFTLDEHIALLKQLAFKKYDISVDEVRILISSSTNFFRSFLLEKGYDERKIRALLTKFRDAGRRSAPWRPASGRVPGRPQDGADGNRRPRWHFEPEHKFYASEIDATLVEVKYIFQTLSMVGAPELPPNSLQEDFTWLLEHKIIPGEYKDPIQLTPMSLDDFMNDPRLVESGHFVPLDRDGRHVPSNTFLMLARSNKLQGNLTLEELIKLMSNIVERHKAKPK